MAEGMLRVSAVGAASSAIAASVAEMPVRGSRAFGLTPSLIKPAPSTIDRLLFGLLISLLLASVVLAKRSPAGSDLDRKFPAQAPHGVARQADIHLPTAIEASTERVVLSGLISEIIGKVGKKLDEGKREALASLIVEESLVAGYDPLFVAAVIKAESTFNNTATSHRGAQGLMQIMPATGRYISERARLTWLGAHQLHEPAYNVRLGIAYLRYLEENFNFDREQMLIAYNWGPSNLSGAMKRGQGVPASSRHYARTILGTHEKWRRDFSSRMATLSTASESNVG